MPTDPNDPLADQNIKDRFYGVNDPVASKLLDRASKLPRLEPPLDKAITTLYVGGLDGKVLEQDLRYKTVCLELTELLIVVIFLILKLLFL